MNILTVLAIPLFLLGLIIALSFALNLGNYQVLFNTISDLGSSIYTPYPMIINGTFMLSPVFLSFYFFNLYRIIRKHVIEHKKLYHLANTGFSFFIIMNIAFFFTGIFSVEVSVLYHNICTIFVFLPLLFGEIILGFVILIKRLFPRYISILMISGHLFVSMFYFIFQTPILEWITFFVLLLWGLPLSINMIGNKANPVRLK
ncbi:MAG: hypothetical protein ACFE8E_06735 [Candidatus Hodarchaeota archaeon]